MNIELLKTFLAYCLIFNVAVVTVWFLAFTYWHDSLYRLHQRWFAISLSQFDGLHYTGMMIYKIGCYFFNVAPLLALWLMG